MSFMLPHLHNGWQVDQAILSEEDRVVVIRFGHDWDPECMKMDETLFGIAEKVKNFAAIYLVRRRHLCVCVHVYACVCVGWCMRVRVCNISRYSTAYAHAHRGTPIRASTTTLTRTAFCVQKPSHASAPAHAHLQHALTHNGYQHHKHARTTKAPFCAHTRMPSGLIPRGAPYQHTAILARVHIRSPTPTLPPARPRTRP